MRWPPISTRFEPGPGRALGSTAIRLGAALVAVTAFSADGCARGDHRGEAPDPAVAAVAAERAGLGEPAVRGRVLYSAYCEVCHGEKGAGDGFNAYNLDPRPADLRGVLAARGAAHIAHVIRDGSASVGRSPLCPPFGRSLGEHERELLLVYLEEALAAPGAGDAP